MIHVKDYGAYLWYLKKEFGSSASPPSDMEIYDFIQKYNLASDWNITPYEVKTDIAREILHQPETTLLQADYSPNKISSYKTYLQKLKETFGIPKVMPEHIEIQCFIDTFGLRKWEITVEDVREDLTAFMDGRYEEMYRDATQNRTNTENKAPQAKYAYRDLSTYTPKIYRPARPTRPRSVCTFPVSSTPSFPHQHTQVPKKHKKLEEHIRKKPKETILIDGDNHFDEGRKGLENESKAKVIAFFSQPGAKKKFDKEYGGKPNISSKLVPPGDQAVDNQIKAMAGQLVKESDQKVSIISQDKGFQKFAAKKNQHNTGEQITVSKSVAKRKQRKKHKK